MGVSRDIKFGFQISAVSDPGAGDAELYRSMISDARYGYSLGFGAAWLVEHHFSDYFPQPSPISILSHVAAQCPGMSLGTMVLVLPWYQPVRLAGDIAVLSQLCTGDLHIGMGRGNAPLEYEAFDVPMSEAKDRFAEISEVLTQALGGEPFQYRGEHYRMQREVRIRPTPRTDRIRFYGAIGNPDSAEKIADLGLAPISNGILPFDTQRQVIARWEERSRANGFPTDASRPIGVLCSIADTDEEAIAMARRYYPRWFEIQLQHYAHDAARHKDLPDYQPFAVTQANRERMANPDNLGPLFDVSLIGSPETIRRKVQTYIDIGFDNFILWTAMPEIPEKVRQGWLKRFAEEVVPHFTVKGRGGRPSSGRLEIV